MLEKDYSKPAIRKIAKTLPYGELKKISDKMNIAYSTVVNVCHGKQYHKQIIAEVIKRYNKVKTKL